MSYIWKNIFLNKKLHILFLCSWLPSRVKPTSGDFVQRHAEAVATKHRVTAIHVITDENLTSNFEIFESEHNGVKIIIGYLKKFNNPVLKFFYFIKVYKKILQKLDFYDLVHLNVTYPKVIVALYLKWFQMKPFIISEHWTDYQYPLNKHISFLRKKITQLITKNASFVCPVSISHQNDMLSFGLKGNYYPVPNVVDTTLFYPAKNTSKKFMISHISSFTNKQKNILGILNVIKQLSLKREDFQVRLIGNGDLSAAQKRINDLSIPKNILALETGKSHLEISKILQQSNLYISFSNYESFGIVMAEAIATATPVISTNTGILTELDASNFTTIIPLKDEDELLKSIIYYLDTKKIYDTEKMHSLIKEKFSIETICNSFSKLYYKSLNLN